jgi:hypothetical protein
MYYVNSLSMQVKAVDVFKNRAGKQQEIVDGNI